MTRTLAFGAAAAIVLLVVEASIVVLVRPAGDQLRPFVDLLFVQGMLLALVGALAVAGKPFLAARTLLRRARRTEGDAPEIAGESTHGGAERRSRVRAGVGLLLLGALFYGLAALIWSMGADSGA